MQLVLADFTPAAALGINGRRQSHWTTLRSAGWEVQWRVLTALAPLRPLPRYEEAEVWVTFVYPINRQRDLDNHYGMAKPLIDTLVHEGLLAADDHEHLRLRVEIKVRRGVRETRVEIIELPIRGVES